MKITEYGEGGFDATKPNNNVTAEYELSDEIENINSETIVSIPQIAIGNLQTQLADPATNSIAKVKTALINFFEEIQEA